MKRAPPTIATFLRAMVLPISACSRWTAMMSPGDTLYWRLVQYTTANLTPLPASIWGRIAFLIAEDTAGSDEAILLGTHYVLKREAKVHMTHAGNANKWPLK